MYYAPSCIRRRSFLGRLRQAPAHFRSVFGICPSAAWMDRVRIAARLTWLLIRGAK
jgi:hypothetical protein